MDESPENTDFRERRTKPRMDCNYTAIVRGQDSSGKKFEESGRVTNLSSSGAFVLVNRYIENGTILSINLALPTGNLEWGTSKIALTGCVVSGRILPQGVYGIAFEIQQFRFA
jgi:hypothetical protein